jgi:hypothetical protein
MDIYLLCLQLAGGDCYVECSPNNQIAAWNDMNLITQRFDSFYKRTQSTDYETHMSAAWGILSFRPYVIKVPKEGNDLREDAQWLKPYVLDMKPHQITGGNVHIPNPMLKVDPKILEYSILDIAKNVIDVLYGRDV